MSVEALQWAHALLPTLKVEAGARVVLLHLAWRAFPGEERPPVVLRFKAIARDTGLDVKTVRRAVAQLIAAGVLSNPATVVALNMPRPSAERVPSRDPQGSSLGTPKGPVSGPHLDKTEKQGARARPAPRPGPAAAAPVGAASGPGLVLSPAEFAVYRQNARPGETRSQWLLRHRAEAAGTVKPVLAEGQGPLPSRGAGAGDGNPRTERTDPLRNLVQPPF
jgi:hypothetical protein